MLIFYCWERASKKLDLHQQEVERQQSQTILRKYANMMQSRKSMIYNISIENSHTHDMQSSESDDTVLIVPYDDSFPNSLKRTNDDIDNNGKNRSEFKNDERDLNLPSRRMFESIGTNQVIQSSTSRRQSATKSEQSKNPSPGCLGPPLFRQRNSTPDLFR
ncbi:uncharacterized protein LOC117169430 [Belonocnema kinseyi]|uniref:uncharacterized protein LOC117169430 n=1 Tax=Belonocnema kinseyi TaxID=2817044 RepID=UPI00143D414B|nr:uncharacterized protein LOC117169430 [Belonocnema kinseyi]